MPSRDSKPPRGKVRPKTPVPTPRRPAMPNPGRRRRALGRVGVIAVPVLALVLAIGLGILLGVRSSRPSNDIATPAIATTETTATTPTQATVQTPTALFGQTCAGCHTLAAAGATGEIGPNLDEAKPPRQRVLTMIRNGSLSGEMPAGLLTGDDAERVATYVSRAAGRG